MLRSEKSKKRIKQIVNDLKKDYPRLKVSDKTIVLYI